MISPSAIDTWLPQTQCQKCEYPDCISYATAISNGSADFNRCPPGGQNTIDGIAKILDKPSKPLNTELEKFTQFTVARIIEDDCIGCTKCISACPVDAIIGSGKRMHTVLKDLCTGCELCIPPCPVDCIELDRVNIEIQDIRFPSFPQDSNHVFRKARQRKINRMAKSTVVQKKVKSEDVSKKSDIHNEILAAVERSKNRLKSRQRYKG